jgi:hypothetical protein
VAFHEHDVAAQSRETESRTSSIRRSSSLGDLSSASKRAGPLRPKAKNAAAQPPEAGSAREEATDARAAVYTDAGVSRCCVMEVDAINCSDVVLQVMAASGKQGFRYIICMIQGIQLGPPKCADF